MGVLLLMKVHIKLILVGAATILMAVLVSNTTYASNKLSGEVTKSVYVQSHPTVNEVRLCQATLGQKVIIHGKELGWFKISCSGFTGYVPAKNIIPSSAGEGDYGFGTVTGSSVRVRSSPDASSWIRATLANGRSVAITGIKNGWYKIRYNNIVGYIHPDYLEPESIPYTVVYETAFVSAQQRIVSTAKRYLGTRYLLGGLTPEYGFDCSGYTEYVFAKCGYTLINRTRQYTNGTVVKYAELEPGDLVFFDTNRNRTIGHVGIYIGNGDFIHAPRTGKPVQINSMAPGTYYRGLFVCARRILS